MANDAVWYAAVGLVVVAGVAMFCALVIAYERGRKKIEAKMTPEERRFRNALGAAASSGWGLPRK